MTSTLRIVSIVCALLGALLLLGCGAAPGSPAALAGTNDIELSYELDAKAAPSGAAPVFDELRVHVMERLGAAHLGADVSAVDGQIRVVVDEALAPRANELITWTGTLHLLEIDPQAVITPREASSGLVARDEGGERFYEGSRADLLRAIETWPIDKDHRILAEARWDVDPPRWRTRVVRTTTARELGDGALVGWATGPTLRIRGTKGSAAAALVEAARSANDRLALARGHVSLGVPSFGEPGAMLVHFGSGAEAYARAQREKDLVATPRLPPLRRVGSVGLPPNRPLAFACVVVPILLSLAWLVFVRRFDRAHPEPMWLVGVTFLLGAAATVPAGLLELAFPSISPWLDPSASTFGGQAFALPLAIVSFTVVVGLSEEGMKRLAAQLALRRREFDEPIDGIVYAVVASLGFAAAENVLYFGHGRLSATVVIARCFMSIPAHMFFGALWGFALGAKLVHPRTRTWAWLLLAALCHGVDDALLSMDGGGLPAVLLSVTFASIFVMLVRRALLHGVVAPEMLAIRPEERMLFRVGRPRLFWASAVLVHLLAVGIFVLGAHWQLSRHRPSLAFVAGSSVMIALLAVAALGITQTLPLDVAVDAYGVTFAGAARPWRKIRKYLVERDRVTLDCEGGPILLGPGAPAVIEALASELRKHLDDDGQDRTHTLESQRDPPVGEAS